MALSRYRIDEEGRECTLCLDYKPWSEYHRKKSASTGHSARCKECSKLYYPDPVGERRKTRMIKQRKWVCFYDPENLFDGSFSSLDFEMGLESGVWPINSVWYNRKTRDYYRVTQRPVRFKNKLAMKQYIGWRRRETPYEKPPVAERQGYRA